MPPRGRAPAALAACALAAGVVAGGCRAAGSATHAALCLASCLATAAALVHLVHGRARSGRPGLTTDVLILVALVTSGALLYRAHHGMVWPSDVSLNVPLESTELLVRVSEVRATSGGRARAVGELEAGSTGAVWIFFPEGVRPPARGELARVSGRLSRPRRPRNPGSFDFRAYLAHRGIHAVLNAEGASLVERARGIAAADAWIRRTIARRLSGDKGDLLTALLLGDSSRMPEEILSSFRRSGTVHVLAVSGLHVGFMVLMAHALLRSLRAPPRLARLLVLPLLAAFVLLVGPRPSVVRASTMASVLILAWSVERRPNPLNTIGVAAVALLLVRPGSLFDAGFGLSFGATLGIVLLFNPFRSGLKALERLGRCGGLLADSLALSSAAQVGVAPISLAAFGQLSLAAPAANIAAVPLAAFSVASGVAMLAASSIEPLARILSGACWASLSGLAGVARAADGSFSTLRASTALWPAAALAAVGLVASFARERPARTKRRAGVCATVATVGTAVLLISLLGPGKSRPRVIVFDVGQGDSILLELPRRRRVLIDAGASWGGRSGWDAGRSVVGPYLRAAGVRKLDALVVTHGHADHYGGAVAVMEQCRPRVLVLPVGYDASPGLRRTADAAARLGVPVRQAVAGDTLLVAGACTLRILSPFDRSRPPPSNENDRSVIVRADLGPVAALLTGDAEASAEKAVTAGTEPIGSGILKVGHHGSSSSSTERFLRAVAPGLAVISVGNGNRYGHPDSAAVRRLRDVGARILRTDRDGAIIIDVLGGKTVARGYASGIRRTLRCGRTRS